MKLIKIAHSTHIGHNKTLENVRKRFTWNGMIADVIHFVNSCETCKKCKHQNPAKTLFIPAPVPNESAQKMYFDILRPLKNHSHILNIIDHFSRHLQLFNLNQIPANAVTKAQLSYISTHDKPGLVLTDQGSQFTSDLLDAFCKKITISLRHITVCNPQASGLSERINCQIKTHQSIYNATLYPATNYTPNHVHFTRELNDIILHYKNHNNWKTLDTAHDIYELTRILHQIYNATYLNKQIPDKLFIENLMNRENSRKKQMIRFS